MKREKNLLRGKILPRHSVPGGLILYTHHRESALKKTSLIINTEESYDSPNRDC